MVKKRTQPARMGKYANIGRVKRESNKPIYRKARVRYSGPAAWFFELSWPKRLAVLAGVLFGVLLIIAVVTYLMYENDIKDPERLMNRNNTGIVLKDVNGKAYYSVGRAERRDVVPLADISKDTKDALIATEDKDFYKHGGFNLFSIVRAAFTRVGGGSTITQQLAKNTVLSDERSLMRKWQELAVSIAIEQNYSKDQILEMYLNSVYFGENSFGIRDAALTYFNKEPKDLTLAESAMLVGVLPAPSAYSPISGVAEYAKDRQTTVLSRMVANSYITAEQQSAALAVELAYAEQKDPLGTEAPHYAQMVLNELINKYGEEKALRSGYQVATSIDLEIQAIVRDSVASNIANIQRNGGTNAAAVVINPTNGEVRALVGSADWNNDEWGKVNMVTTKRQPGSSFKPIYYAAALADGVITPSTVWKDERTDFGGGYVPLNADRRWHGDVTTRNAIAMSLNIPSVKIMQQYGIDQSIAAARNLGISTLDESQNYGLSLSLGSAEIPLMEMTNAYAAFANQGQQFSPTLIRSVSDKFNKTIFSSNAKPKQAINKEGAYLISNILSDANARAPIFGNALTISGQTTAVKTGTTNDNRDAWTIGYTPEYAMGVWVGNNDNSEMLNGGVGMAGPIWRNGLTNILQGKPRVEFERPSGIVERSVCRSNGGLAIRSGSGTYTEVFMAGALPTETCNAEPVKISVCDLDKSVVITINEEDFDEDKHSRDTSDCKPKKMTVCDLLSGKTVTITGDEYEEAQERYSTTTANCKKQAEQYADQQNLPTPITVCDTFVDPPRLVTLSEQQYNQNPSRYTTDLSLCPNDGRT